MPKKIVIVGAGYAGVLTAKKLARRLKKFEDVTITIVDKNPYHTMLTELHEVAAGRVEEDSIRLSLKRIFAGRRVDVKMDTIQSIDFAAKKAVGKDGVYEYDILVMAAGSQPTYFGVTGAEEHSFKLWSYDDAVLLRDHIQSCFRKAAGERDLDIKRKLLSFYVVGAGFTGVEMAGELAEYVPILCDSYEIDRSMVTVAMADVLPRVVPNLTEKVSAKIERRLVKMGVKLYLNNGVTEIGPDFIQLKCGEALSRHEADTVIWCAGIESASITEDAAKTLPNARRCRLETDKYLRSLGNENVYVVGDNLCFTPEGETAPVPQMVENCEQSSDVAAHNIVCAVTGKGELEEYRPAFHGVMVSVGGRYASALVGTAKRKFSLASFFAMFVKHFINIIYYIQVLGWNKVFSYLKHEFFTVRHDRSFVGGHFSNKTPSFLLMPLRVWLGAVWLFEGIKKIVEGWLGQPMLTGFFKGANDWYNAILTGTTTTDGTSGATAATAAVNTVIQTAVKAVDATSSATGAGGTETAKAVGHVLVNFDFLGLFKIIFVSGKDLASATLSDYAFKLDIPLMNWFVNQVILPNTWLQMTMQIGIVIAEILIGLALIGGLFTTPSTALSLVLQVMFVCTTGLYLGTFWMIFAAIALLIGSGRVLGLDYYAMPFLKKKWKKVRLARKSYLYHD